MTNPTNEAVGREVPHIFEGYLTESEYCHQRGISPRTAQRDRQLRQSPPYVTIGKKVMYRIDAVREWLLKQERHAERRASGRRAGRRK